MSAAEPGSEPGAPAKQEREPAGRPDERRRAWRDLGACALVVLAAQLASVPLGVWFGESLGPLELAALVVVAHGGMLAGVIAILRRRGETLTQLGCTRPARGWR